MVHICISKLSHVSDNACLVTNHPLNWLWLIGMKLESKYNQSHTWKSIWKCLQDGGLMAFLMAPSHHLDQCVRSIDHIRAILKEIIQLSTAKVSLNITYLRFHSSSLGANELSHWNNVFTLERLSITGNCRKYTHDKHQRIQVLTWDSNVTDKAVCPAAVPQTQGRNKGNCIGFILDDELRGDIPYMPLKPYNK